MCSVATTVLYFSKSSIEDLTRYSEGKENEWHGNTGMQFRCVFCSICSPWFINDTHTIHMYLLYHWLTNPWSEKRHLRNNNFPSFQFHALCRLENSSVINLQPLCEYLDRICPTNFMYDPLKNHLKNHILHIIRKKQHFTRQTHRKNIFVIFFKVLFIQSSLLLTHSFKWLHSFERVLDSETNAKKTGK